MRTLMSSTFQSLAKATPLTTITDNAVAPLAVWVFLLATSLAEFLLGSWISRGRPGERAAPYHDPLTLLTHER